MPTQAGTPGFNRIAPTGSLCTRFEWREHFGAGLFGRGEVRAAVLALGAIHHPEPLAVGAGFARWPFLHAEKCQQPGHTEQQVEDRPAGLRREGEFVKNKLTAEQEWVNTACYAMLAEEHGQARNS